MVSKRIRIAVSLITFIALQAIKPLIVVFIYKEVTNFHPTIVNNYEIYQMVIEHIFRGSINISYTAALIASEILFLSLPLMLYRKLSNIKS